MQELQEYTIVLQRDTEETVMQGWKVKMKAFVFSLEIDTTIMAVTERSSDVQTFLNF